MPLRLKSSTFVLCPNVSGLIYKINTNVMNIIFLFRQIIFMQRIKKLGSQESASKIAVPKHEKLDSVLECDLKELSNLI